MINVINYFSHIFLCIKCLEEGRRFDPRILHPQIKYFSFKTATSADYPSNYHSSTAIENAFSNRLKQQDLLWIQLLHSVFSSGFPFYVPMPQKELFWYGVFNSFPLIKEGISGFISNLCHPIAVWYLTSQNMMQLFTY